jgi:hypothetical protein
MFYLIFKSFYDLKLEILFKKSKNERTCSILTGIGIFLIVQFAPLIFEIICDRFAYMEYHRLAAEEENGDAGGNYENAGYEIGDCSPGEMEVDFDHRYQASPSGWDDDENHDVEFKGSNSFDGQTQQSKTAKSSKGKR